MGNQPTFIDLFAGCGGFTLGMVRAGFRCVAAIDFDECAIDTLDLNIGLESQVLPRVEWPLCRNLEEFRPKDLHHLIRTDRVDVIVGGPPCQGFSTARQVDGANHGKRLTSDRRRFLYREFLRYVAYFQPTVFVMENVLGLRSAAGGRYFTAVQKEARQLGGKNGDHGYRVHSQVEDAWQLGAPQKRRRQLIIGVRADVQHYFAEKLVAPHRASAQITLGQAIGDLPRLKSGSGVHDRPYDLSRRKQHLKRSRTAGRKFLYRVLEVRSATSLTSHVARPHNARDLRDFAKLKEGESSAVAMRVRGTRFEYPYDKDNFKDRYTRQSRSQPCSTIVAHLSKDGLMFIHPKQNRSLTPREAARIQTFPDWYQFPPERTHAFRLIGNAVPPVVAESVGHGVRSFLRQARRNVTPKVARRPSAEKLEAVVSHVIGLGGKELRAMSANQFQTAWHALLHAFPSLHPDNALDHGAGIEPLHPLPACLQRLRGELRYRYQRSGWPVALAALAREAWRRFYAGEFKSTDLYIVRGRSVVLDISKELADG